MFQGKILKPKFVSEFHLSVASYRFSNAERSANPNVLNCTPVTRTGFFPFLGGTKPVLVGFADLIAARCSRCSAFGVTLLVNFMFSSLRMKM